METTTTATNSELNISNRRSVAEEVRKQGMPLDIIQNPNTGKVFFACGKLIGYVSKNALKKIKEGCAMTDLEIADITTDDNVVIPSLIPHASVNCIATFGASLLK